MEAFKRVKAVKETGVDFSGVPVDKDLKPLKIGIADDSAVLEPVRFKTGSQGYTLGGAFGGYQIIKGIKNPAYVKAMVIVRKAEESLTPLK